MRESGKVVAGCLFIRRESLIRPQKKLRLQFGLGRSLRRRRKQLLTDGKTFRVIRLSLTVGKQNRGLVMGMKTQTRQQTKKVAMTMNEIPLKRLK